MTPERWRQVTAIFASAVDRPLAEREAFVIAACEADAELWQQVTALLREDETSDGFLDQPAADLHEAPGLMPGTTIGPYRVVQEIGRGGMGAVYLAERDDQHYDQRVAIKLIKRGMDTDQILQRFRAERQILANLAHPNIARLLDGGATADGLPYLVMEYLEGEPIDAYCAGRALPLAARLALFRTVCAAVHHAHQHLVIHRDLKPGNILVDRHGVPKLLDFGLSRLVGPDTGPASHDMTEAALRFMTPEYASPEQLRGAGLATTSDVYSLGVILYELVTGGRPYRFHGMPIEEAARLVADTDPVRPSSRVLREPGLLAHASLGSPERLRRKLRGDLDNIVLKAIRKDPSERYSSVERFSDDLGRHLDGVPVEARRQTWSYQAASVVKRHKTAALACAAILLTLLGGMATTLRQARRAERRFNDVRALATSLVSQLNSVIETLPGSTPARAVLATQALAYLDSLAAESESDLSLQRELAAAYQNVGDVQSRLHRSNIGDTRGALDSYAKSLAIRERLVAADRGDARARLDLAIGHRRVGDILSKTNQAPTALEHYRIAVSLTDEVLRGHPADAAIRRELAEGHMLVGRACLKTGRESEAADRFRAALAIRERLLVEDPADRAAQRGLVASFGGIAYVLALHGDTRGALALHRQAMVIAEALAAAEPTSALAQRGLMDSYEWLAIAFGQTADDSRALEYHSKALAIAERLLAADPSNAQAHNDIADVQHEIGNVKTRTGHADEALASFRRSLTNYTTVSARDPHDTNARRQVHATERQMAQAMWLASDATGAIATHRRALAAFQRLAAADPANAETQYDIALTQSRIGEILTALGRIAEAETASLEAIGHFRDRLGASPANSLVGRDLARTYATVAAQHERRALAGQRNADRGAAQWQEARDWYERSLHLWGVEQGKGALAAPQRADLAAARRGRVRSSAALARIQLPTPPIGVAKATPYISSSVGPVVISSQSSCSSTA